MEYSVYKIIRNANERNILIINQYFDVENSAEIQEDKFESSIEEMKRKGLYK